jgi:hypothetical protein
MKFMLPWFAVTLVPTIVAVVMTAVAWRVRRAERRRSEARVAWLAEAIHAGAPGPDAVLQAAGYIDSDLFAMMRRHAGPSRWGVALVAGVLAIGAVAAIAVIFGGEWRFAAAGAAVTDRRARSSSEPGGSAAAPAGVLPLELVALGHEQQGDRLAVRGMVLNPRSAAPVNRLTAVVFGFGREGEFLASGRSAAAPPALQPGATWRFEVTIPAATDVVRYRVSFRTDDRVMPHVDRRTKS